METYKYTNEDYLQIHNLVYEYKNGSNEAIEILLQRFDKFFVNYAKMIKYGKYNINNYSTTAFVKLFVENSYERRLINPYYYIKKGTGKEVVGTTINTIMNIFSTSTYEDIVQDLKTIFVIMCSKYKDVNPTFHAFINRNFHFHAFRYWRKSIVDPLGRGSTLSIYEPVRNKFGEECDECQYCDALIDRSREFEEEHLINNIDAHYIKENSNIALIDTQRKDVYNNNYIDINWINGATCIDSVFKILTPSERKIIKYWYIDNYTDTKIGEILGLSRCVINKRRNAAKEKIIQYINKKK